ncbi:DNA adenine methylase [Aurantiacibacter spongiae]|nr:DNA adenine methylase [Aurantiacibacter spongiae]
MGTKRHLAPVVADLVDDSQSGPLLDLFSGMCSVGQAVAPARQVWSNDLQRFAYLVATCQFCGRSDAPDRKWAEDQLVTHYSLHKQRLATALSREIDVELEALSEQSIERLSKLFEDGIFQANRISHGEGSRHQLFIDRYSGTYFGISQSVEIDAIRYAIDHLDGECAEKDWLLVALCSAMARCANTTGHFAQALNPKQSNIGKVLGQRMRSVWDEFLSAFDRLEAIGEPDWRAGNRAFQTEAASLLAELIPHAEVGVVYADPPYTADQYSRYYHLYETAILYDYPAARGRGLYRDNRPVSQFSHASKVRASIEQLIARTSRLKADLILSYPADGLLPSSRSQIGEMIKEHFGRPPEVFPIFHNHSTMGASKGDAKRQVTELLYRARS